MTTDAKKAESLETHIADSVIEEALRSVEKCTGKMPEEQAAVPAEAAMSPAGVPPPPPLDVEAARAEIQKLQADLHQTRHALRQREAELETSQELGRETLARLKDQHERMLRAAADLENYKKRAARERDEAIKFGQEKLVRDLLPVLDNLDRATEHARTPADFEGLKAGVAMTRKLFEDTLGRHGVKGFSALSQMFDPRLHEAIQSIESDAPAGTVIQEIARGFLLNERLMRPAVVAVARPRAVPVVAEAAPAVAPEDGSGRAPESEGFPEPKDEPKPQS